MSTSMGSGCSESWDWEVCYRNWPRRADRRQTGHWEAAAPGPSQPLVCALSIHDQQTICDSFTNLAVHIRVGLSRRFSELPVFDALLYIRVRRIDEPA